MKIKSAEFTACAVDGRSFPKERLPEIALIGRSNVGKSSLINTLVNRKGLAHTSSQPGKTRTINFYRINGEFYLVDLPGFGYAAVSREEKRSWEQMIDRYLEDRPSVKGALVILDARRETGEGEEILYDWIGRFNIPVVTVFTKADKLSNNELASNMARLKRELPVAASPVPFSATKGTGKVMVWKKIREMLP